MVSVEKFVECLKANGITLIGMNGLVTAIEAHSGITVLIAEKTAIVQDAKT